MQSSVSRQKAQTNSYSRLYSVYDTVFYVLFYHSCDKSYYLISSISEFVNFRFSVRFFFPRSRRVFYDDFLLLLSPAPSQQLELTRRICFLKE